MSSTSSVRIHVRASTSPLNTKHGPTYLPTQAGAWENDRWGDYQNKLAPRYLRGDQNYVQDTRIMKARNRSILE